MSADRPLGHVVVLCPGGLEHGGGIGRQMGYFLHAHDARADAVGAREIAYRVVDTRGPWFLGASRLHVLLSVFYLIHSAIELLVARLSPVACVVHVNITGRGSTVRKIMLVALIRALALRYVLHVHDYDYGAEYRSRGPVMRGLIAGMFRAAAYVLVLGLQAQRDLSSLLQIPAERILVLHNAVPDPLARAAAATAGEARSECHLVFLGRLSERKGVPELLRALAAPALISRPWRATLAGGGPIEQYRRMADELGLAARIDFPGWLDQPGVDALCAEADVLVLPSYAEGLAMSVLEGLAHGLAVVATPVGAHAEVIETEISGLLVQPGDADALADALRRVVDDAALRARLQAGARRRFLEKFNIQSYAERLGRLHAGLLPTRRSLGSIASERSS